MIETLAEWIRSSAHTVALTGAGVSTESGIPDFRSPASGLWAKADPMRVASIEGFLADPACFYGFWRERFGALAEARPNAAHEVLGAMERAGWLHAIVTQNIDGLHQEAGSSRVLEVHGAWRRARCTTCGRRYDTMRLLAERRTGVEACDVCGGLVKPDVVLFGEAMAPDFEEAERAVDRCELLLVLGSSLEVWPVAGLAPRARRRGAKLAILNRDETAMDEDADLVVRGELGMLATRLRRALGI
jgi:NAD-dependent deacetylase